MGMGRWLGGDGEAPHCYAGLRGDFGEGRCAGVEREIGR